MMQASRINADDSLMERFVRLLSQHEVRIFNCILSLLPRWSDAEDVYQECSMVIWRRFEEFDPATDFPKWACHIAYLTAMNYRRKQHRERMYFSNEFLDLVASRRLEDSELLDARRDALEHCLEKLPPQERELLRQRYAGSRTLHSLAAEAGRTARSYYRWLDGVRQRLMECIRRMRIEGSSGTEVL
jgi:RNA polymerase sigma-70 factor (ECF subfamily)